MYLSNHHKDKVLQKFRRALFMQKQFFTLLILFLFFQCYSYVTDEDLVLYESGALVCQQGNDSDDEYFSELSPRITVASIFASRGIDETIDAALYAGFRYVKSWFQSEG
jgi:hypothetical protein